ncbi:unnamed protein product [Brachionus calyciflorus]|uniref:Uncharacterized protein n=1 Tax=Brachionus calyciflorus TaxID=104777 RepID=A0A814LAS6_9BILA|nr:unnamed protein product [Brachionus calyciflorus]
MTYSDSVGENVLIVSINDTHDIIHNSSPTKKNLPNNPPQPTQLKSDILDGFSKIKSKIVDKNHLEFYNYVEDNYVGKYVKEKVGRGRGRKEVTVFKDPLYPIKFWNENERLNECIPKTNNFVEAWLKAFSSLLNKHPLVYSLVHSFINEQRRVEADILKLITGIVYKLKPRSMYLDTRLKNILQNYKSDKIDEVLVNLSLIMKY